MMQAFPDALFHHLILAMSHPDHETRVVAHRVFSNVLMPAVTTQPSSGHKPGKPDSIDEETHSLPNG